MPIIVPAGMNRRRLPVCGSGAQRVPSFANDVYRCAMCGATSTDPDALCAPRKAQTP